jgi:hypothetical protein
MTSSDDDLDWLLTRELRAEADRITPAEDGLSQIRRRLRSRPFTPVWGGLRVDAERYGYRVRYVAAETLSWIFRPAGQIGRVLPRHWVTAGKRMRRRNQRRSRRACQRLPNAGAGPAQSARPA